MIILQLDSDQLVSMIKSSVRSVLAEQPLDNQPGEVQFLTIKEAASLLNLAPQTLYGYTSNRTIPFIKKGKKLYFRKSDLDIWLLEGRKLTLDEIGIAPIKKEKGGKHG